MRGQRPQRDRRRSPLGYGRIAARRRGRRRGDRRAEGRRRPSSGRSPRSTPAIYAFDAEVLRGALPRLGTDNAQGEEYLTDVLAIARERRPARRRVRASTTPMQAEGVNDRVQLARLRRRAEPPDRRGLDARGRHRRSTRRRPGSTSTSSSSADVDAPARHPAARRDRSSARRRRSARTPRSTDCRGRRRRARSCAPTATLAVIGAGATVGPFAYLRPGTDARRRRQDRHASSRPRTRRSATGAKVPHLSYVGDATIGEDTNIGAGTIFVNYDGVNKHRTTIGAHVRIGADNMFVAPVDDRRRRLHRRPAPSYAGTSRRARSAVTRAAAAQHRGLGAVASGAGRARSRGRRLAGAR